MMYVYDLSWQPIIHLKWNIFLYDIISQFWVLEKKLNYTFYPHIWFSLDKRGPRVCVLRIEWCYKKKKKNNHNNSNKTCVLTLTSGSACPRRSIWPANNLLHLLNSPSLPRSVCTLGLRELSTYKISLLPMHSYRTLLSVKVWSLGRQ